MTVWKHRVDLNLKATVLVQSHRTEDIKRGPVRYQTPTKHTEFNVFFLSFSHNCR